MTDTNSTALSTGQTNEPEGPANRLTIARVLLVGLVVGIVAVVWLVTYVALNDLIWGNDFVAANKWTIPVGVMFFSLLVGLVGRYLHAPNVIKGGALEPLMAGDTTSYKSMPGMLLSSFFSLFSGASVGPEGPIGFVAVYVSEWLAVKLKLAKEAVLPTSLAGMSSAYNGIVGNPMFAALFASEASGGKGGLALVATNLAAGAVGFLLFAILKVPPFAGFLADGVPVELTINLAFWAIALGVLGALLALYTGAAMRVVGRLMAVFDDRIILRALVAGAIISVVCYFIPDLMFSGEGLGPRHHRQSGADRPTHAAGHGVAQAAAVVALLQGRLSGRPHLPLPLRGGHDCAGCQPAGAGRAG